MCMFCAAVPVAAATGVALDNKQKQKQRAEGRTGPRLRPIPLMTAAAILLLLLGSAFFHLRYPKFW